MRYTILPLLVLSGLLLAGCPADDPDVDMDETVEPRAEPRAEPRTEPRAEAEPDKPMIEQYKIKLVDHVNDLKEFRIRQELGGIERMLEEGIGDRRELNKRKSDLEKELKKL